MIMKHLHLLLIFLIPFLTVSCGSGSNEEPDDPGQITRVQDGNGKVFIENGQLITANINYSSAQLNEALTNYEWERQYCIYYDNSHVSGIVQSNQGPVKIHPDGIIKFDSSYYVTYPSDVLSYNISGKQLTVRNIGTYSSHLLTPITLPIVALDFDGSTSGRIIMDMKANWDIEGFDNTSAHMRMIWKGIAK